MFRNLCKLSLISAAYILCVAQAGNTQVLPRYKNYIISLNETSKNIISQNPNKKALLRRHLVKMGLIPLRELPLEDTFLVRLADKKLLQKKKAANISTYFNYLEPDYQLNENDSLSEDFIEPETAAALVPNDPETQTFNSWGLDPYYGTDALDAWDMTTGGTSEVVAILGTGIDMTHPDLTPNLWQDSAPSVSNKKETAKGFNYFNTTVANLPNDDHGLTTFAAGIIGAKGNNAVGIAGINWNGKLMALKVASSNGASFSSTVSQVVEGIDYAMRKKSAGANVVAIFNFLTFTADSSNALKNKIEAAGTAGLLFITAAGDNNKNLDTQNVIPSSFNLSNMITVGSYYGELNAFKPPLFSNIYYSSLANAPQATFDANYGTTKVHLAAPGERVRSTWKAGGYNDFAGTTISAAYVAGAASLIKSYKPSLTMGQLKDVILNNVRVYNTELTGKVSTKGVLDIYKAMKTLQPLIPGDYDRNGIVENNDYTVWKANYGMTGSNPADGNGDGVVNAADYTVWRDNLGRTS